MRSTTASVRAASVLLAALAALVPSAAASAHEGASIGDLDIEVGFAAEPAYVGQPNGVQLVLVHDGKPVDDLGDGLTVEVSFGDQTSEPMPFEPAFFIEHGELESGVRGEYVAAFIPTQAGPYTFHVQGKVEGEKVDESFTSSRTGFDEVQDPAAAAFPPVTAPTNEELASRIEQESARAGDALARAEAASADAASTADRAQTIAVIAVLIGSIGVIVAIAAIAARKRA